MEYEDFATIKCFLKNIQRMCKQADKDNFQTSAKWICDESEKISAYMNKYVKIENR